MHTLHGPTTWAYQRDASALPGSSFWWALALVSTSSTAYCWVLPALMGVMLSYHRWWCCWCPSCQRGIDCLLMCEADRHLLGWVHTLSFVQYLHSRIASGTVGAGHGNKYTTVSLILLINDNQWFVGNWQDITDPTHLPQDFFHLFFLVPPTRRAGWPCWRTGVSYINQIKRGWFQRRLWRY